MSPDSALAYASPVQVTGSGFTPGSQGAVVECNMAPNEPTITIPNSGKIKKFGSLPVGCTDPVSSAVKVAKDGSIFDGFGVNINTIGPPVEGNDSTGVAASTDAANYPCPPTEAQVNAGVSCAMLFQDPAGESAFADISFTTPYTTTTTTTTTPPTTTQPCNAVASSIKGMNTTTGSTPSASVDPGTCLVGGMTVTVTASGLVTKSEGSIVECNNAPNQPTVSFAGEEIPVSCSKATTNIFATSATGTIPTANQTFTVLETTPTFTIGGQTSGAETGGTGNLAADAAKYPCPPTAAQIAAGDSCVIAVGDAGGDEVPVPISFNTAVAPPASGGSGASTASGGSSTTPAAKTAATQASSSSLAFTGTGPGMWWLALLGILLMILGGCALALVEGPRRLTHFVLGHERRRRGDMD